MYDVVGIDSPVVDLNVNVDKLPQPNHGERVRQLTWQGGGKVATGMVASARLGAKCAIMGAVGDDNYGQFMIKDFQRHGINTDGMIMREGETSTLCIVLSDKETGGRSIMGYGGTAQRITIDEVNKELLRNAKYFFISYVSDITKECVDIAREAGVQIFIDADGYTDEIYNLIPKIDVFVASEFFYDALFKDKDYEKNCRAIMDMGPKIVVFTFGPNGCVGLSEEGYFELPTFPVEVVDTVGAGDVFHGAFLAGLLSGRSVKDTANFSNAVSSIKCTRIGGRAGIPAMKTVERFMADGVIDYTEIDQRVEFYKRGLENNLK